MQLSGLHHKAHSRPLTALGVPLGQRSTKEAAHSPLECQEKTLKFQLLSFYLPFLIIIFCSISVYIYIKSKRLVIIFVFDLEYDDTF